eukprot:m.297168 g.297168  ORF g.297168 m.297168 type:complete len:1248 (+) comp16284_c0_seq5:187-3930(+)
MELCLRDFLSGHVLRQGLVDFESVMGPWVRATVQQHVGIDPDDDIRAKAFADARQAWGTAVDLLRAERDHAVERVNTCKKEDKPIWGAEIKKLKYRIDRVRELRGRLAKLNNAIKTCLEEDEENLYIELKAVTDELATHGMVPPGAEPTPRWVQTCQKFFGQLMKPYVTAHNRWDVYTIVVVMRGMFNDVFASRLQIPDHFHAKELLGGILRVWEMRNDRAHRGALTEADVLEALRLMSETLKHVPPDAGVNAHAAAEAIDILLGTAKDFVRRARTSADGVTCDGPTLLKDDANAQLIYSAVTTWELHVEQVMGLVNVSDTGVVEATGKARLAYRNPTIAFGRELDAEKPEWVDVVKTLQGEFKAAAPLRHWYFHGPEDECDVVAALAAMSKIAATLSAADPAHVGVGPWAAPTLIDVATPTTVRLNTPTVRMSVPVARHGTIVGREVLVNEVADAVCAGDARVIIHGGMGVGKDAVMAQVAGHPKVQAMGGLQAWLQASSDVVLKRQLVNLFTTHRPEVVEGCANDASLAAEKIKEWLSANSDWVLCCEDANPSSTTLWDVLPDVGGSVVMTSQIRLQDDHPKFSAHELEPFSTKLSLELLRSMNLFEMKAPPPAVGGPEVEAELQQRCVHATAHCYVPAPQGEKRSERKQRRKQIETNILEHRVLSDPHLPAFLEDRLDNLPLAVIQCSYLLRTHPSVHGVPDLIKIFNDTAQADVDRDGRDPMLDQHYYGLYLSVKIAIDRLRTADVENHSAETLLAIISLLDRTRTPLSLLMVSIRELAILTHDSSALSLGVADLLGDSSVLTQARELCMEYGLLQLPTDSDSDRLVGVLHQLVQRCVRDALVTGPTGDSRIANIARWLLRVQFTYDNNTLPASWAQLGRLVPCIQAWADNTIGRPAAAGAVNAVMPSLTYEVGDGDLISRWALMLLNVYGDAVLAKRVLSELLEVEKKLWASADEATKRTMDTAITTTMENLAGANATLGDFGSALDLQGKVVTRRRHLAGREKSVASAAILIGALINLAEFCRLRMQDGDDRNACDAVVEANTLAGGGVVPPSHPVLVRLRTAIANVLELDQAVNLERQNLAVARSSYNRYDPRLTMTINNLANSCGELGYREVQSGRNPIAFFTEQHKLAREAVDIWVSIDGTHVDAGLVFHNYGVACTNMQLHDDAIAGLEKALAIRKDRLLPGHTDIAVTLHCLAVALNNKGDPHAAEFEKQAVDIFSSAGLAPPWDTVSFQAVLAST